MSPIKDLAQDANVNVQETGTKATVVHSEDQAQGAEALNQDKEKEVQHQEGKKKSVTETVKEKAEDVVEAGEEKVEEFKQEKVQQFEHQRHKSQEQACH